MPDMTLSSSGEMAGTGKGISGLQQGECATDSPTKTTPAAERNPRPSHGTYRSPHEKDLTMFPPSAAPFLSDILWSAHGVQLAPSTSCHATSFLSSVHSPSRIHLHTPRTSSTHTLLVLFQHLSTPLNPALPHVVWTPSGRTAGNMSLGKTSAVTRPWLPPPRSHS